MLGRSIDGKHAWRDGATDIMCTRIRLEAGQGSYAEIVKHVCWIRQSNMQRRDFGDKSRMPFV